MFYKWKPSKSARVEFAKKMQEIEAFCLKNDISKSKTGDSFYFDVCGQAYRVSNHSIEASNRRAFNEFGEQTRELYHEEGREADVIYIHASKTRLIEIYEALKAGAVLDGRGNKKN